MSSFKSPWIQFFTVTILCLIGRLIRFEAAMDIFLDLEWLVVLISAFLFSALPVSTGIVCANSAAVVLAPLSAQQTAYAGNQITMELAVASGMIIGAWIIRMLSNRIRTARVTGFTLLAIFIGMAILTTLYNMNQFTVMMLAAVLIISFLSLWKMRSGAAVFWQLFSGWAIGQSVFMLSAWSLQVDPNSAGLLMEFLRRNHLLPFPVFLLQILIAAVIIQNYDGNPEPSANT